MASSTNANSATLPTTHTASGTSSYHKPPPADLSYQKRRHRHRRICYGCLLATLILLAVLILVLFLTVLRIRDPTTRLVSTRLAGVAPRLNFPALSLQLNVTLLLSLSVHNPNAASFAFPGGGHADLTYRGAHVGDARIDPGSVPSRGDGDVTMALTLQADRFVSGGGMARLVADVEAGSLPLEASTRIPGKVNVFGIFKRKAVAYSDCSFVFGVAELAVRSQECRDHTKL